MVAKSITKLLDEAIIPAIALIVAKTLSLFLVSSTLNLPFTVESGKVAFFLPAVHFATNSGYIVAENYSNMAMLAVVSIGTLFVIIRAHFFHESHIHPNVHSRLASMNLSRLVSKSYDLYHQAAIWLAYLWLVTAFLIVSSVFQVTYPQISVIAFLIAANFSWIIAVDVQKEVEVTSTK